MRKRIISLAAAASLIMSVFTVNISAADAKYDEKKWNLLTAFEIIYADNIEDMANTELTRGEYVTYLLSLMKKDELEYEGNSQFSDISEYDSDFNDANVAKQLGYVTEKTYRANDEITYAEAKQMLLRAMGYGGVTEYTEPKLPAYNGGHVMTVNDMVELFYAAMHESLLKYDISAGESITLKIDDDKTILSEYYDVEVIEGIVTEDSKTTLYSGDKKIDSYMGIDEKSYGDSENLSEDYLGYCVRAYIDYSEDEDYGNLLYISEKANKNITVTIEADEIEKVNEDVSRITYTKEGQTRAVSKKIDENVNVIYNGKAYTKYTAEDFMPANGNVTLIDNDNDGTFEVAKIWSYETMFVEQISSSSKLVYNKFDYDGALTELNLNNDDGSFEYEIFENDTKKDFSRLKAKQVLSVAKSKNKENPYIRIYIGSYEEKGVFKKTDRDENTITFSDTEYGMTAEFLKEYTNISTRAEYTIYFDAFGRVAAVVEIPSDEYSFVYLYSAIYDEAEGAAFIKVFTTDGGWKTYSADDKVKLNGKSTTPDKLLKYDETYKRKQLADELGFVINQVLKIKTADGKITEIKTAQVNGEEGEFNVSEKKSMRYYGQNRSFGHEYFMSASPVIFSVPSDDRTNLDAYRIKYAAGWDVDYITEAYNYDEYSRADVFVIESTVSSCKSTINDCLILGVEQMIDSHGTAVDCIRFSFGMFEDFSVETSGTADFTDLKKGDIVTLSLNEENKVVSFARTSGRSYSWSQDGKKLYRPTNLHVDGYQMGKIVKSDPANQMVLAVMDESGKQVPIRVDYTDLVVKRYNVKKNTCQVTSVYDFEPGDYFVMYSGGSYAYTMIIFDDDK